MADLVIFPALLIGAVIGLIEMVFVHSDEIGMGWFMHGLHAFPFTLLFAFISINVSWALTYLPFGWSENFTTVLIVRAAVAVIGMLKVAGAAAIAGRVGERFPHTMIIGALIFAAPYLYDYVLAPMNIIPNFF